jgi:hypothetical protein
MSIKLTSIMRGWKKICKVEEWCQMGFQTQHMVELKGLKYNPMVILKS